MSATPDMLSLLILLGGFIVGAVVLYFVVRAAIISALERHALWRADGSYEVALERHRRDSQR
ncbi:hypothetical protein ACTU6V_05445 [Microbacterium sp. A204]|uniref:hypothetical protein n=1 Tax=Microbacterium sp. A204 TaxID=3457321 RepID=UPI003FD09D97